MKNTLKIITGKHRGKSLAYPENTAALRPTKNRVREALFNILGPTLDGKSFLDLCAGTGSIGLEALSRGATPVTLVDNSPRYLKKNAENFPEHQTKNLLIVSSDAPSFVSKTLDKYDVIFFDPPWHDDELYNLTLKAIADFDILNPRGILVIEHQNNKVVMDRFSGNESRYYNYGESHLTVVDHVQ